MNRKEESRLDVISEAQVPPGEKNDSPTSVELTSSKSNRRLLWVAIPLVVATGTLDSILIKTMNKQELPPCKDCNPRNFEAPWWQTLFMYIGETLCLFLYFSNRCPCISSSNSRTEGPRLFDYPTSSRSFTSKPKCPFYWWIVPTVIDLSGTTLLNYANTYTLASTAQMFTSVNVVMTAVFSLFMIKLALRTYQWMGVIIITFGLMLTGIFSVYNPEEDVNTSRASYVGLVFAMSAIVLEAFKFVFEERVFREYYCSPVLAVGIQGGIGVILTAVILGVAEIQGFEKSSETVYMFKHSIILIVSSVLFTFSVGCFNTAGLICSKHGSGLLQVVVVGVRALPIWIIELILGWNTFDILQLIALVILLLGTAVFNGIPQAVNKTRFGPHWNKPLICFKFLRNPDIPEV